MTDLQQQNDMRKTRQTILRWMADLFATAPTRKQLKVLLTILNPLANAMAEEIPQLRAGCELLEKALIPLQTLPEPEADLNLNREYTRLFCLSRHVVGTTASVILTPQRLNKREPWFEVRRFYREHGWEPRAKPPVLEDSLSMELTFFALLIDSEEESLLELPEPSKVPLQFLTDHLLSWVPEFVRQLKEAAPASSPFVAAALLLEGYLEVERTLLTLSPEAA